MAHIKNEAQYRAACDRVNELLRVVNNETPSDDHNLLELDMLSDMVADYEEQHFPVLPPEETEKDRMSFLTLFTTFPFLNATAMAQWMGINPAIMRRYKAGLSSPRGKNRQIISEKMALLSRKLADFTI